MRRQLPFLLAAVITVLSASSVQAGLVASSEFVSEKSFGMQASLEGEPEGHDSFPHLSQIDRVRLKGLANGHGMSGSGTLGGVSSAPGVAILDVDTVTASAEMIARLRVRERVWLPPPFSSGLFRPPRDKNDLIFGTPR